MQELKQCTSLQAREYGSLDAEKKSSLQDYQDHHTTKSESPEEETSRKNQPAFRQQAIAVLMYILALISTVVSTTSTQVLGGAIPIFQLNFWRFFLQTVIVLPICIYKKCAFKLPKTRLPHILVLFAMYNVVNITLYTASIYVPLGVLHGMWLSVVIVVNVLLSVCIVEERRIELYVGASLAVIGVQLMTQPDFMFPPDLFPAPPHANFTSPCTLETHEFVNTNNPLLGYALVITCGIVTGLYWHGVRYVMPDTDTMTFAFWNGVFGFCVSIILMLISREKPVMPTSARCILLLLTRAVFITHETVALSWCLQYISPTIVSLLKCMFTVVFLVLQYTLLRDIQPGKGNWLEIVGCVVVLMGTTLGPFVLLLRNRATVID